MTRKEAVIAAIQIAGYSESAIDKAFLDAGIDGSLSYISADKTNVDLIVLEVLRGMLAVSSVTEGGYSISYSTAGVQARIDQLSGKDLNAQPKIKAVRLW